MLIIFTPSPRSSQLPFPSSLNFLSSFSTHQVQIVLLLSSWVCGFPLEHGWLSRGNVFKRITTLPLQYLSLVNLSLAKGGTSGLGSSLHRACAFCRSYHELLHTAALLCLYRLHSFYFFQFIYFNDQSKIYLKAKLLEKPFVLPCLVGICSSPSCAVPHTWRWLCAWPCWASKTSCRQQFYPWGCPQRALLWPYL